MKIFPKKDKFDEITLKDFQNLYDNVIKLERDIESFKSTPKTLNNLSEQYHKTRLTVEENQVNSKTLQNLTIQIETFKDEIKFVKDELQALKNQILSGQERLEQTIRTQEEIIMDMIGKFNGCILAAENGTIIYQNAMGIADADQKEKLTLNHSFRLASISKQFTAMAIMILKDRSKISYEDDIRKYIPELPYKNITIRNVFRV